MNSRFPRGAAALLSILLPCVCVIRKAEAQAYPSKPVRVIVPSGAGGSVDTLGRLLAQKLTASKSPVRPRITAARLLPRPVRQ